MTLFKGGIGFSDRRIGPFLVRIEVRIADSSKNKSLEKSLPPIFEQKYDGSKMIFFRNFGFERN